ncbi:divisome protein SepX/GlpR [Microlunatus kandeliicorticis]
MTGLIYAAIAVAWLAFLIPTYLRRRDHESRAETDPRERFSDSVRIVRSGTAPVLDQDLTPMVAVEISTPMTRRAAIRELRRMELVAAGRRRRVLLILMAVVTLVLGACAGRFIDWAWLAVPGGLLVAFVVVSRFSVRAMRRNLDARFARICHGNDEKTVFLRRTDLKLKPQTQPAVVAAASPASANTVGLWDPLPITMPTYVSKPLAPRTVRTIDLSAPDVTSSGRLGLPVTADGPAVGLVRPTVPTVAEAPRTADEQDLGRAVGE